MEIDKTHKRFLSKIDKTDTCWNWTGALTNGYGTLSVKNKGLRAHRYSYEHFKGKIPEGLVIDHLCDNRKCVNPEHLKACTHKENVLRGKGHTAVNARKTHCKYGHPFSGQNLRIGNSRHQLRICRKCHLTYQMMFYRKNKEKIIKRDMDRYWRRKAERQTALSE